MNAIDDATKSPTARARPDIPALQAITANGLSLVAAGGAEPAVDIVFIHGLQGHPEHTWTYEEDHVTQHEDKDSARKGHSLHTFRGIFSAKQRPRPGFSSNETGAPSVAGTNRCFWPSTLLARDLPNARIFTYGYDSSVTHFFFGAANKSTITDNGRSFLQSIVSKRTHCPGRPLIFIAHSLGGLVVKAALLQASRAGPDDDDYCDVLASTIAIMFFGTPHRGSEWVDQGQILRKFASAFGFSTSQYNLKLLRRDSEMLELLRDEFARLLQTGSFRVTSFYETVGFKGLKGFDKLIVEKADACIDHPSYERKLPISENHVGMCKFGTMGGRNAEYNEKVKAEIDLHLKRHQRNIEQSRMLAEPKMLL